MEKHDCRSKPDDIVIEHDAYKDNWYMFFRDLLTDGVCDEILYCPFCGKNLAEDIAAKKAKQWLEVNRPEIDLTGVPNWQVVEIYENEYVTKLLFGFEGVNDTDEVNSEGANY